MAKLSAECVEEVSAKIKVAVLYAMLLKQQQESRQKCSKMVREKKEVKITAKSVEVHRVQTDWHWWDADAMEMTDNQQQDHETDENPINDVGKGKGKGKGSGECLTW